MSPVDVASPHPPAPQPAPGGADREWVRPVTGLVSVLLVIAIVALSITLFRGGFSGGVPVIVMSPRAGLVMDPDAKVKMLGVQVGTVASIEPHPDGQVALHLSIDSAKIATIPANTQVDIASTTVFGAKYVQLIPPAEPATQPLQAGQVLQGHQVTVEINTVFEQLNSMLTQIEPAKLNASLGAMSRALSGRGKQIGQAMHDFDDVLVQLDPALPALSHDLSVAPKVLDVYADGADDLMKTVTNATQLSKTIVDQQKNFDRFLLSLVGLGNVGNQLLSSSGRPLIDVMHLLVPTSTLLDQYNPAINCGMLGMLDLADVAEANPTTAAGIQVSVNFSMGHDRYRYPADLPKVAASGGPQCEVLPVKYETHPPYVVTDTGTNPFKRGNQQWVLNSDGLKQLLFGPLDGPPRNSAQIGQPG